MRNLALILVLACATPVLGDARSDLSDHLASLKCTRPDKELIKPGTADRYNGQVKGFNDCLRIYVENENGKIAKITANAKAEFQQISDAGMAQIHDIERAIAGAVVEVRIVNGQAQDSDRPPPRESLTAFPDPACKKPDETLLKPVGKRAPSLANTDRYEAQRLGHENCIRAYIAQARGEIVQVKANAEAAMQRVADDANPRIAAINAAVTEALNDARKTSNERDAAVGAIRAPWTAGSLAPGSAATPITFQPKIAPGTESVTVTGERLSRSADQPTGAGDPDAISCRAPQPLTNSRLMGPEVCKRNREWAQLAKEGKNVSSDGQRILESEKSRTYNPVNCINKGSMNSLPSINTTCNGIAN